MRRLVYDIFSCSPFVWLMKRAEVKQSGRAARRCTPKSPVGAYRCDRCCRRIGCIECYVVNERALEDVCLWNGNVVWSAVFAPMDIGNIRATGRSDSQSANERRVAECDMFTSFGRRDMFRGSLYLSIALVRSNAVE